MTRRRTWLEAGGILGLGVAFLSAWAQCHAQADRANKCEATLAHVKEAQRDVQIRRIVWEMQRPCGVPHVFYPFNEPPNSSRCEEVQRRAREGNKDDDSGTRFWRRMMDCARSGATYDNGPIADTVDSPYVHDSWVLRGDCEALAHALRKRPNDPLCEDFIDDDHESAERCRRQVEKETREHCLRADLDDDMRRDCLIWWKRG